MTRTGVITEDASSAPHSGSNRMTCVFKAGTTAPCTAVPNAWDTATCRASLFRTVAGIPSLGYTGQSIGDSSYNPSSDNGGIPGLKLF
ncbi:MAG: hypothetical protein ACT4QA_04675 [Panacagrimonas sp.]